MAWKPAGAALGFKDNRSVYVNTATGETMGRREYDRTHGRFKGREISSNEAYGKLLKAAGLPKNTKGVVRVREYKGEKSGQKRRHITFTGDAKQVDKTLAKLNKVKGFHNSTISVVHKNKKGEYHQSKAFDPRDSNIGASLAGAYAALESTYGDDDDENLSEDFDEASYDEAEFLWGESL